MFLKNDESHTEFVAPTCPSCGAKLKTDCSTDTFVCEYCGSKVIIESNKKNKTLDTIFKFVERQQDRRRQAKEEKKRIKEEQKRAKTEHRKKYLWLYILIAVGIIAIYVIDIILK